MFKMYRKKTFSASEDHSRTLEQMNHILNE